MKRFEKRVYLASPYIHEEEREYVREAFDTKLDVDSRKKYQRIGDLCLPVSGVRRGGSPVVGNRGFASRDQVGRRAGRRCCPLFGHDLCGNCESGVL